MSCYVIKSARLPRLILTWLWAGLALGLSLAYLANITNSQVAAGGPLELLSQPQIILAGGGTVYAGGDILLIFLRDHTPGLAYDLKLNDGGVNPLWLGRTEITNANGDTPTLVSWTVPPAWPNGLYTLSSHPAMGTPPRDPATMITANQTAGLNIQINTPTIPPYLTVEGGYNWPAGSAITIRVWQHASSTNHYLKFGPWPVPTLAGDNTFPTDATGAATITYRIPLTAAIGAPAMYVISSFLQTTPSLVTTRTVTVLPVPVITVLEGSTVPLTSTITISLLNHISNTPYRVIYANKDLFELITNAQGQAHHIYNLALLPTTPPPDLSDPTNQGLPFEVSSRFSNIVVATTTLAIAPSPIRVYLPLIEREN
ncbi:MAG: hypothetical protein HC875_01380 [Anaerolineales bacterium]|nr:hypothetical protein [Anaerolineales bacterium]